MNVIQAICLLGSVAAAFVSASWIKLAAAPVPENWWEASPYVIFIAALGYAVSQLWRALREADRQRAEKDKETIERQSAANERLADAIESLSRNEKN